MQTPGIFLTNILLCTVGQNVSTYVLPEGTLVQTQTAYEHFMSGIPSSTDAAVRNGQEIHLISGSFVYVISAGSIHDYSLQSAGSPYKAQNSADRPTIISGACQQGTGKVLFFSENEVFVFNSNGMKGLWTHFGTIPC